MGTTTKAFTAEYGTKQGRIETPDAPAGSYILELGHADAGVKRWFKGGDHHRVESLIELTGMQLIRTTVRFRKAATPPGFTWKFKCMADEVPVFEQLLDRTFGSIDFVIPAAQAIVYGGTPLPIQFELELDGPVTAVELELPSASVDALIEQSASNTYEVYSRVPTPNDTAVPLGYSVRFVVERPDLTIFASTAISLSIGGVNAIINGVVQSGWSGSITPVWNAASTIYLVVVTPDVPFEPLTEYAVSASMAGNVVSAWSFTTEDTIAPIVESAFSTSPTTVRVVFDEPIAEATAMDSSSYTLSLVSGAPAVVPGVLSVEFEAPRTVVLTLATLLTRGAIYQATVVDVTDLFGNVVAAPNNSAQFAGYRWPVPAGRRTKLFEMLPEAVQSQDTTGEHERFLGVMQELFDLYYGIADKALEIIDPDFAPIEAVDNMLLDLGNPFDFLELTDIEKRILVQTLLAIYKTKGTGPGIVNALRFFLGIETSIRVYAWAPYPIGEAIIGETFVLGSSDQADLYTFELIVGVFLTDTERKNLTAIVNYMKVAHEHWRLIEPEPPVFIDHWQLGFSRLDTQTILHSP